MTLRLRIALVAAAAVGVVLVAAGTIVYGLVRHQLLGQVNSALYAQEASIKAGDFRDLENNLPGLSAQAGGPAQYGLIIGQGGQTYSLAGLTPLPVTAAARRIAPGGHQSSMQTIQARGATLREVTFGIPFPVTINGQPQQVAVEIARPLTPDDNLLSDLRGILFGLGLVGVLAAGLLGRLAARRVLSPLAKVTALADHIGDTGDLSLRIDSTSSDEVGQLADRFDVMLAQLDTSQSALEHATDAQRQLIADASHELRTPVTSLRTNVEFLMATESEASENREVLGDMVEQAEELTTLVSDLIELARGDAPVVDVQDIRLDVLVDQCIQRARRAFPIVQYHLTSKPIVVEGIGERLERAINNLLDNAGHHSSDGGLVDVLVNDRGLTVRDHGSGIAPKDVPHVFDRFYRGENSRAKPGSGLGLAIVQQVAEQHAASVSAANAADGGAIFAIEFHKISGPDHEDVADPEARQS